VKKQSQSEASWNYRKDSKNFHQASLSTVCGENLGLFEWIQADQGS